MTKINTFINRYQDKILEDSGPFKSPQFITFAKEMRGAIKNEAAKYDIELASFSTGHYDVSGFLKKSGKYIYFAYSVPRMMSINFAEKSWRGGFLYRTTSDEHDFKGGGNNFTSLDSLIPECDRLFECAE